MYWPTDVIARRDRFSPLLETGLQYLMRQIACLYFRRRLDRDRSQTEATSPAPADERRISSRVVVAGDARETIPTMQELRSRLIVLRSNIHLRIISLLSLTHSVHLRSRRSRRRQHRWRSDVCRRLSAADSTHGGTAAVRERAFLSPSSSPLLVPCWSISISLLRLLYDAFSRHRLVPPTIRRWWRSSCNAHSFDMAYCIMHRTTAMDVTTVAYCCYVPCTATTQQPPQPPHHI